MTGPQISAAVNSTLEVRPATDADRDKISNLIFLESHVHRHLDWRGPLDWIGYSPYWVLQEGERILGALACAPDPDPIAWIRLFVFSAHMSGQLAWQLLWKPARTQLVERGGVTAAAIATQRWLDQILVEAGFDLASHIVLLERDEVRRPQVRMPAGTAIRIMMEADLSQVTQVDGAAFGPLWHNSQEALTKAFAQASYATVAEDASGIIGYQLSTGSAFGTHLARLAVSPHAQKRGLGAALVSDLIVHLPPDDEARITVNTQANNAASLALYHRLGFRRTGERYPVYTSEVH